MKVPAARSMAFAALSAAIVLAGAATGSVSRKPFRERIVETPAAAFDFGGHDRRGTEQMGRAARADRLPIAPMFSLPTITVETRIGPNTSVLTRVPALLASRGAERE